MRSICILMALGLLFVTDFSYARGYSKTQCVLPKDQGAGSFIGAWNRLPVTLVFDKEFYTENNGKSAAALKRAVHTWNEWARLKGMTAFVILNEGTGADIPKVEGCTSSEYTERLPDVVGIWKIAKAGDRANRRPSCGFMEKLLPDGVQGQTDWIMENGRIRSASILLNYDNFNSPGERNIDEETLLLHQLGEVLGLLHSCNGSNGDAADATSAPLCSMAPKEYLEAVMFPFISPGEIRRSLRQNDFNRVNCLY